MAKTNSRFRLRESVVSYNEYSPVCTSGWHHHENIHFTLVLKGASTEQRKTGSIACSPGTLLHHAPHKGTSVD